MPASRRRDRSYGDDEGGHSEKRRRKGSKRRKKDKNSKSHYDADEAVADMMDNHEESEDDMAYRELNDLGNDQEDGADENTQGLLAAAGLEDSDAEEEVMYIYFLMPFLIMIEAGLSA